jgi:hypothetical protein
VDHTSYLSTNGQLLTSNFQPTDQQPSQQPALNATFPPPPPPHQLQRVQSRQLRVILLSITFPPSILPNPLYSFSNPTHPNVRTTSRNERGDRVYATRGLYCPFSVVGLSKDAATATVVVDHQPRCGICQLCTHKSVYYFSPWSRPSLPIPSCDGLAATSFCISLPPPYIYLYSAGGPTGEVHVIDPSSGNVGEKVQQILFPPDEKLEHANKTRVALVSNIYSSRSPASFIRLSPS